jgi:hypothetical protein
MVRYETAASKAKPAEPRMTTLAVGEEGGAPGGGGGRATTMAVGEEGGSGGGGGGGATTMAVGEEGGSGGGGGRAVTLAIPEDGGSGRITTLAIGEEGGGGGASTFTAKVTNLLSDEKINNKKNDYHAYGRTLPGHTPPLFGQQFKFGKAEAVKLTKSITANYEPAGQKKILKEIHMRSSTNEQSKGTVALTRDAAAELNKLAKKLGLDLKFTFNQPRPIHPVG